MDSDSDSQQPHSFGAFDQDHLMDDNEEISGNISQLSEDDDLTQQIMNKYQERGVIQGNEEEKEEEQFSSEQEDHVNEMSFNKEGESEEGEETEQNQDDQEEEEEQEENQQEEEEEESDQEMSEMKSKFDRIMANFVADNNKAKPNQQQSYQYERKEVSQQEHNDLNGINSFKNKNMQNNVKGIFKNIVQEQTRQQQLDMSSDEENTQFSNKVMVEGPNKENDEQSVNIKFNSRKHFPDQVKTQSKPPMPKTILRPNINENNAVQENERKRAATPDREQVLRENMMRNKSVRCSNQRLPSANRERPVSAKVQVSRPYSQQRPKTAGVRRENKENCFQNVEEKQVMKKPSVPKQTFNALRRPQTAVTQKSTLTQKKKKTGNTKKKTDPVSRYQNLQHEWKKNNFLKVYNQKQGRKLDLDRFHKWTNLTQAYNSQNQNKKGQVHKYIQNQKAPTDDRRDDLRFQLRAKISQKDYVDRDMKNYHYNLDSKTPLQNALKDPYVGDASDKLEQLKKQINHLKKCIE